MSLWGVNNLSKILIVDDTPDLVNLLKDELEAMGHEVLTADNGVRGIDLAKKQPDLIILDIMLPQLNGFEVCRAIRDDVFCPIIFLSAKQSETDKLRGFNLGGDDYITKPFGLRELMAKIKANLRREQRSQYVNTVHKRTKFYTGNLALDTKECSVKINNQLVALTPYEYAIVELLMFHAGQVFSREHIYEKIWGYDGEGNSSTVVEHIKKIRAKFAKLSAEKYIATVWGIGYKWNKL